jgi:hypothetical protein
MMLWVEQEVAEVENLKNMFLIIFDLFNPRPVALVAFKQTIFWFMSVRGTIGDIKG